MKDQNELFDKETGEVQYATGKYAGKNTDDIIFNFGKKHSGKRMAEVPADYLRWVMNTVSDKPQIVHLATRQLEQRGSLEIPQVDLSPHAVDRASQRMLAAWLEDTNESREPGLYRWLAEKTGKAIAEGTSPPNEPAVFIHDGFVYFIAPGNLYPTLKSVRRASKKQLAELSMLSESVASTDSEDDDLPF